VIPRILALCGGNTRRVIEEQLKDLGASVSYSGVPYEPFDQILGQLEGEVRVVVATLLDADGRPVAPLFRRNGTIAINHWINSDVNREFPTFSRPG
jgi:hypothetical protein